MQFFKSLSDTTKVCSGIVICSLGGIACYAISNSFNHNKKRRNKKPKEKKACDSCERMLSLRMYNRNQGRCCKCKIESKSLRQKLWFNEYGEEGKGICSLCQLNVITPFTFEIAHDLAKSKGGKRKIGNTLPACSACNDSQKVKSFAEFRANLSGYDEKVIRALIIEQLEEMGIVVNRKDKVKKGEDDKRLSS
jgi:hypothetical protein